MAAQDFQHLIQEEHEKVPDFIAQLEKTFHLEYGKDRMAPETSCSVKCRIPANEEPCCV